MPPIAATQPSDGATLVREEFERGELQLRARPDSYDQESHSVELTWSTGARVKRCHWRMGEYIEELSMEAAHVDLSRLKDSAPVLDSHWRWGIGSSLAVVEDAWLDGKEGAARIRFGTGESEQEAERKVRERLITKFSVGYEVHEWERSTDEETGLPLLRAVRWTPYEISLVTVPADPGASVRGMEPRQQPPRQTYTACIRDLSATNMPNQDPNAPSGGTRTADPAPAPTPAPSGENHREAPSQTPAPAPDPEAAKRAADEAAAAERTRQKEIRELCRKMKVGDEVLERLLENGSTLDQARAAVIDARAAADEDTGDTRGFIKIGHDELDNIRAHAENALLHRVNPEKFKLDDEARELRGMGLQGLARLMLARAGVNVLTMSPQELAKRALSRGGSMGTSDFPELMSNVGNKSLRGAYDEMPATWQPFTKIGQVSDFKPSKRIRLGDAPALSKVPESGEYRYGKLAEEAQEIKLAKSGVIVPLTWEMIVNDDLSAFSDLVVMMGRRARHLESDLVWGIISGNVLTSDGNALFSNPHGNLGSGAIGQAGLTAAKTAMRLQKDLQGTHLNIAAEFIAVPTALEETAAQYLKENLQLFPAKNADVNTHRGTLTIVSEPRLDAVSSAEWYLLANKSLAPVVEMIYLAGEVGPTFEMEEGFDVDVIKYKVRHVCEAGPLEWRGGYKSSGS